jgi:integrase
MATPPRRDRSPITQRGYRKGYTPPNKGRKLVAEVLTHDELDRMMAEIRGEGKVGVRNRAMVALMYRAGFKVGQVLALERHHYKPGAHVITVPGGKRNDREIPVDAITRDLLARWLEVRRTLDLPTLAPFFPSVSDPDPGNPINSAYVRECVRLAAKRARIDKRVSPSTLRKTWEEQVAERSGLIVRHMAGQIDEAGFGSRYPEAYERWRDAFDLYRLNAERHAGRIGHDCRDAITAFAATVASRYDVPFEPSASNTIKPVRAVLDAIPDVSPSVREFLKALLAYWGTLSDLAMRQDHAAAQAKALSADDSRRLVFQALVVMAEIDSALRRLR